MGQEVLQLFGSTLWMIAGILVIFLIYLAISLIISLLGNLYNNSVKLKER